MVQLLFKLAPAPVLTCSNALLLTGCAVLQSLLFRCVLFALEAASEPQQLEVPLLPQQRGVQLQTTTKLHDHKEGCYLQVDSALCIVFTFGVCNGIFMVFMVFFMV